MMNAMTEVMKRYGALALAVVIGVVMVGTAIAVTAAAGDRSEQQGTRDPMTDMMRGMRMGPSAELLGRERPLLSLALQHRAELGLSADQVKMLEDLVERFRKDAEARVSRIEAAEQELAGLLKSDSADMTKVEAKVRAIESLRTELRLARIGTIAKGQAVLSPEQRKKLEELVASRPGGSAAQRTRGMDEMERFMSSERMPQAMTAMMDMARRMGDGDVMLGMVRMMEMMGSMGGMMGGPGGGMMGGPPDQQAPQEPK
jgi:Spy/CpxP family protein refolding chaperone